MVLSNPVILGRIFSCLAPADLKTAALVSRKWRAGVEISRFWAWANVRLGRENFSERRRSPRLCHVGGVLSELDLTTRQLRILLRLVEAGQSSLTSLNVSGSDLSSISPRLLSRATVRLSRATFYDTNLTPDQVSAIFTGILGAEDLRLERLRITLTSLKTVHPWILSRAIVKLSKIPLLSSTNITEKQLRAVFNEVARSPVLKLRKLRLHQLDLSSVHPGVFSQALVRLEQVDLTESLHTEDQVLALFQQIVATKQLRLRQLKLFRDVSLSIRALAIIPPGLLSQALVRLEKVDLTGFTLTHFQSRALLKAIVETPELRLRWLTVVAGLDLWTTEQYLSQALVRLEKVDLAGFCFREYVADALCREILATKNLKLRSLKLYCKEHFPATPGILKKVQEKIIIKFYEY